MQQNYIKSSNSVPCITHLVIVQETLLLLERLRGCYQPCGDGIMFLSHRHLLHHYPGLVVGVVLSGSLMLPSSSMFL